MYLKIALAVIVLAASLSSAQACSPWDPRCYEHHRGHHHHSAHHKKRIITSIIPTKPNPV
jgi:hypothetical protein